MAAALCLLLLPLSLAIEPARQPTQPVGKGDKPLLFNETTPARLVSSLASISWISGDEDGKYMTEDDDGAIVTQSMVTGESEVVVPADEIPEDYWEYWVSPEADRVLWSTNYTKQ
jgi:dipeptidyl-peptidase 4